MRLKKNKNSADDTIIIIFVIVIIIIFGNNEMIIFSDAVVVVVVKLSDIRNNTLLQYVFWAESYRIVTATELLLSRRSCCYFRRQCHYSLVSGTSFWSDAGAVVRLRNEYCSLAFGVEVCRGFPPGTFLGGPTL